MVYLPCGDAKCSLERHITFWTYRCYMKGKWKIGRGYVKLMMEETGILECRGEYIRHSNFLCG